MKDGDIGKEEANSACYFRHCVGREGTGNVCHVVEGLCHLPAMGTRTLTGVTTDVFSKGVGTVQNLN